MGRHPLGGHTQDRDQWLLEGSGCGLGIWVGGSFSFTTNSLVQLGTVQTDYRLHLPFVYKIPNERWWETQGCPAEAQPVRGEELWTQTPHHLAGSQWGPYFAHRPPEPASITPLQT